MRRGFFIQSKKRRVEAFNLRSGPTISGIPQQPGKPGPTSVGGELFPIDKLSVFISNYLLLLLLLMILPVIALVYKKRNITIPWLTSLFYRLFMSQWL